MTKQYTTIAGDIWDGIAFKLYGDSAATHLLMEANPDQEQIVVFPPGVSLVVPDLPTRTAETLPPWKRRGAAQ